MQLQVNRQDGIVWVADGERSVEIHPRRLSAGAAMSARAGDDADGDARLLVRRAGLAPSTAARARPGSARTRPSTRRSATRFGALIERALRGELEPGGDERARRAGADPAARPVHAQRLSRHAARLRRRCARARGGEPRWSARRQDEALPPFMRGFVYLPFEHAEGLAMQDEAMRLFTRLVALRPAQQSMLDYAQQHRDVIERFGRFPHRNDDPRPPVDGRGDRVPEAARLGLLARPGRSRHGRRGLSGCASRRFGMPSPSRSRSIRLGTPSWSRSPRAQLPRCSTQRSPSCTHSGFAVDVAAGARAPSGRSPRRGGGRASPSSRAPRVAGARCGDHLVARRRWPDANVDRRRGDRRDRERGRRWRRVR